jgi:ATP-dependent DNA helicase DinG
MASYHKERTLLSTHTITLQEQLVEKDIPQLLKALGLTLKVELVKGMGNYACLRKIEDSQNDLLLMDYDEKAEFIKIEAWAQNTTEGSKSTLSFVPTHAGWDRVSAESDTCSATKCPFYENCFFFKARRRAEDAQLLIGNHHLLFADLSIRAETENYDETAILPTYSHVVIDEAHHIEDVATEFFGARTSKLALFRLLKRLMAEKQGMAVGKVPQLREKIIILSNSVPKEEISSILMRLSTDIPGLAQDLHAHITTVFDLFCDFVDSLESTTDELTPGDSKLRMYPNHYETPFWKNKVVPAASALILSGKKLIQSLAALESDCKDVENERFQDQCKLLRADIVSFSGKIADHISLIDQMVLSMPPKGRVRWIEINNLRSGINVGLVSAPLDVSTDLAESLFSKFNAITLCSATLTTNRHFDFIRSRLGITKELLPEKKITENIYEAPFNYPLQSMLAIPTNLPAPTHGNFLGAAVEQIWRAIEISRGGCFVLFTSYSMMQKCHEMLFDRLVNNRYALFKQGDANRQHLLKEFKNATRGVLFGTDSFWEGVDVSGEALRCVIIAKLPFRVPTEPIIQARAEAIEQRGGDPFMEYTLPSAIVKFKQGFGRLIRNRRDRGCILCLDSRLISKNYGKMFLSSLPDCQRFFATSTEIEEEMRAFYRRTHHLIIQ